MVAVPGPSAASKTRWEGRRDGRTRQFAEPGDDEVKAGHDLELLLLRTIRGDKVGRENTRPERAFFRPRAEAVGKGATRDQAVGGILATRSRLEPKPQSQTRFGCTVDQKAFQRRVPGRDYFSPAITQKPVGCVSRRRHRTLPQTLRDISRSAPAFPCLEPSHHHQGRLAADAHRHLLFFRLL